MRLLICRLSLIALLSAAGGFSLMLAHEGESNGGAVVNLPELYVNASHTAITEPASTFAAPVSRLELNPQFDLQVRNLAEAQGDVTVRGGIFEGTGFRVGAATLIDPQTGHYSSEIPIAPEMLAGPTLLTGAANSLGGFNSTVGTVAYAWSDIGDGGMLAVGVGDNGLNFQRYAQSATLSEAEGSVWAAQWEASSSESRGTVENGDHDFVRYSGRIQRRGADSRSDLFAGYQSKYLAWPELYAAPFGSPESDSVRTTLLIANHEIKGAQGGVFEASAYFRRHHDHYLFNRFSDSRAFVHETEVAAAAVRGSRAIGDRIALGYAGQFTSDRIESTRLENTFTSRSYLKLSLLPEFLLLAQGEGELRMKLGGSFDDSNRDASAFSPVAELEWQNEDERYHISFSQASQVAGYTAIGGGTSGLFASNPDLRREVSSNFEFGAELKRRDWSLLAVAFFREDGDLVDWTYSASRTSARSARNVDIDTLGLEIVASRRFAGLELLGSLSLLDKDEDYQDASVDASFYALNYAELRATAAAVWSIGAHWQLRVDNEYRQQRENLLRQGSAQALFTHLSVSYALPAVDGLELSLSAENLWGEDFQEIPGTPGRGRQFSLAGRWLW